MKSHSRPLLPLLRNQCLHCCLAALLCLPACRRKPVDVSGQVFIVTPDGAGEKQPLVGIHVLGDGEFGTIAASVLDHLAETDRRVAQAKADNSTFDAAERICRVLARRDDVIPGLDGVLIGVRACRLALGSPGSPPTFDDLLDGVIAALPPEVTRTDADGRFTIPVTGKAWVIAVTPGRFGQRAAGRLWMAPCEAGETGKAGPLLLSNNCLVPDIHAFAAIAGRDWRALDADKMSATPGVVAWAVAAVARADQLVADAERRHATAMTGAPGD